MKHWTLALGVALSTPCCLAGPPDKAVATKKAADDREQNQLKLTRAFDAHFDALIYPGAKPSVGLSGGGGGGGKTSSGKATVVRTADSFETVVAFYSRLLLGEDGEAPILSRPEAGGSGGAGGAVLGSGNANRPLKMTVLNSHNHYGPRAESATVIVSRGDHEDWTYIHIVLNVATTVP